jgi:hypothetical protein
MAQTAPEMNSKIPGNRRRGFALMPGMRQAHPPGNCWWQLQDVGSKTVERLKDTTPAAIRTPPKTILVALRTYLRNPLGLKSITVPLIPGRNARACSRS